MLNSSAFYFWGTWIYLPCDTDIFDMPRDLYSIYPPWTNQLGEEHINQLNSAPTGFGNVNKAYCLMLCSGTRDGVVFSDVVRGPMALPISLGAQYI